MARIDAREYSLETVRTSEILVVDPHVATLEQLRDTLMQAGYTGVHTAADPAAAPALCRDRDYDLLIIAVGAGPGGGLDLMAEVMSIYGGEIVPVLVLVDEEDVGLHRRALELGAADVLIKPCAGWEMLHSVRNALRTRALYRRSVEHNRELEHRVAERTRALEEALGMAQRAERAKFDFLSVMSHELRTPLNSIVGFSEMLSSQPHGPLGHPEYVEYVRLLEMSGRVLLDMVNNILDFARGATGAIELRETEVDVNDLLGSCLTQMWPKAQGKRLTMSLEADRPVTLFADRRRLAECVTALLDNAIKFQRRDGRILLRTLVGPETLRIEVIDDGPGMSKEVLARLFEPFVQGDRGHARRYEGIGLGLSMVRRLTELHGGWVTVESEEGRGTTVALCLPLSRLDPPNARPRLAAAG